MAVPKSKVSKQRSNTRYANWKVSSPAIGECPQCHEPKASHRVCKNCGYYDGQKVLTVKEDKE